MTTSAFRRVVQGLTLEGEPLAVREAIEAAPVPDEVADAILAGLASLGQGPFAVRSSATAEDLPGASLPGQQDSFLDVRAGEVIRRG